MTPSPPPVRVAVNDRQLPVVAVMDRGRVLVPLRAIVEALHADLHAIKLPLPKPARIIAGRWYVPVRAMANLVHARIEYDGRAKLVAVYTANGGSLAVATPMPSARPVEVTGRQPASDARVGSAFPTIAANVDLPNGSSIRSLQLTVDGVDVTSNAIYQGTYVTYIPRAPMTAGAHTVDIAGTTSSGQPFDTSWTFETTQPPPPADTGTGYFPGGYQYISLTVPGTQFIGGASVPVQLIAPPGGAAFAFICTSSWQYQLFSAPTSQFYSGSVPTPTVNYPINCPITAMYVAPDGAVSYAAYPQFVQLLPLATPQPTPVPTATPYPSPTPIYTRIPRPTPIATRTPAPPKPIVTHGPLHPRTPAPEPTVRPVVRPVRPVRPVRTPRPAKTARPTPPPI